MVDTIEVSEGAQHKVKQASGTVGYACPECRGRGPFFWRVKAIHWCLGVGNGRKIARFDDWRIMWFDLFSIWFCELNRWKWGFVGRKMVHGDSEDTTGQPWACLKMELTSNSAILGKWWSIINCSQGTLLAGNPTWIFGEGWPLENGMNPKLVEKLVLICLVRLSAFNYFPYFQSHWLKLWDGLTPNQTCQLASANQLRGNGRSSI